MLLDLPGQVDIGKFPQKVIGPLPSSRWFFVFVFSPTREAAAENTSANLHLLGVPGQLGLSQHFSTTFGIFLFCFWYRHVIYRHFLCLAPPPRLAGVHGRSAQTPGAQPADADGAEGL